MTKGKGYLLPPGDASEDELECCLVFYPARDEYRRALMGSLDYLATWIAWERDSEKRGQDAAASWKLANIQTWECCSMGYCDDLLTTLEALLAATTALECCGDQDITDGRQYTDEIVDGEGDVPQEIIDAGYADDAADWDGFNSYKCMISHLAVDHVESFFREIAPHISDTGIVIGGVGVIGALIGAILTLAGLPISAGIIVALGAAAAIWTWITSEGRDAVEDLADEIAANHDDLACAIYQGDGVSESVSDFNDAVDSLFTPLNAVAIKAINLEPQLRAMYSGRYDQEDIAAKLEELGYGVISYDCSGCDEEEPPSGYHLAYPLELNFFVGGFNVVDNGSTYNPATGILVLNYTNVSNNQTQFIAYFTDDPHKFGKHGWKFTLLAKDIPGSQASEFPTDGSPVKGSNKIHTSLPTTWWYVNQTLAGYNTSRHSGSTWVDWADQYDNVVNGTGAKENRLELRETPASSAPTGDYSLTMRVQILVED